MIRVIVKKHDYCHLYVLGFFVACRGHCHDMRRHTAGRRRQCRSMSWQSTTFATICRKMTAAVRSIGQAPRQPSRHVTVRSVVTMARHDKTHGSTHVKLRGNPRGHAQEPLRQVKRQVPRQGPTASPAARFHGNTRRKARGNTRGKSRGVCCGKYSWEQGARWASGICTSWWEQGFQWDGPNTGSKYHRGTECQVGSYRGSCHGNCRRCCHGTCCDSCRGVLPSVLPRVLSRILSCGSRRRPFCGPCCGSFRGCCRDMDLAVGFTADIAAGLAVGCHSSIREHNRGASRG